AASDAHGLLNGASELAARQLRAGDPEVTPAARLLHEGIPTLFAPEPENPPLVRTKKSRAAIDSDRASAFADSYRPANVSRLSGESLDVIFPVLHGTFGED